jgi:hypothetical protein
MKLLELKTLIIFYLLLGHLDEVISSIHTYVFPAKIVLAVSVFMTNSTAFLTNNIPEKPMKNSFLELLNI